MYFVCPAFMAPAAAPWSKSYPAARDGSTSQAKCFRVPIARTLLQHFAPASPIPTPAAFTTSATITPAPPSAPSNVLPWTGVALGGVLAGVGGYYGLAASGPAREVEQNLLNPLPDGSHLVTDQSLRERYAGET
jgi:hypothetical protein